MQKKNSCFPFYNLKIILIFAVMNSIIKDISELLYLYDCVIVPGLGGFVGNYKPPGLREEHNLFIPPAKSILFNRSLSYNDGLLADFISKKESVQYREAVEQIHFFVKDLLSKLSSSGIVELGNIGLLKKDINGNFLFIPNEESSFLPDAFGLTSFRFFPIEQKDTFKIEFQDDTVLKIKNHSVRNWAAAAFVACFSLFSTDLKMPFASQAGIVSDLFTMQNKVVQVNEENSVEANVTVEIQEIKESENVKVTSKKYHLIAGSYLQNYPAAKLVNEYKSEGFSEATIIDDGNGRIRVSLLSFSDKNEALSTLEEFRKQSRFSTVWLLVQ